uniref:Pectinesterase n=1 Tax=Aegilops tauschii subsp. strangulata TaxID=200361 RepID=A0A453GZJ1_AEGTS
FINKQTSPSPAAAISRTISVNHSGRGDFKHIQQAIDSIPDGNSEWIRIHVAAGTYRTSLTMLESECTGPGSNRTGRVPWSRVASGTEVARFTDINYVSSDGWLGAQPH